MPQSPSSGTVYSVKSGYNAPADGGYEPQERLLTYQDSKVNFC